MPIDEKPVDVSTEFTNGDVSFWYRSIGLPDSATAVAG